VHLPIAGNELLQCHPALFDPKRPTDALAAPLDAFQPAP